MATQLALFALGIAALGLSPLVVGLTVVAFGTSAPEVAVSVGAAIRGSAGIAVGNVVGSNVFNVLFILGASALIAPLVVDAQVVRQEVPIMVAASLALAAATWNGVIGYLDGALFVGALVGWTGFVVVQSRRRSRQAAGDGGPGRRAGMGAGALAAAVAAVVAGLALLVLGARWLVGAAVHFAQAAGVSETIVGLTIVAAGTSLPEVAASFAAALKGERDIAVGNIVGSCTFNILGCLGLSALASPGGLPVPAAVLNFDLWVMVAVAVACLPVFFTGHVVARWEGAVFLAYYAAYVGYLILAAADHDALPRYSATMLGFVLPITVLTVAVVAVREWRGRSRGAPHHPSG